MDQIFKEDCIRHSTLNVEHRSLVCMGCDSSLEWRGCTYFAGANTCCLPSSSSQLKNPNISELQRWSRFILVAESGLTSFDCRTMRQHCGAFVDVYCMVMVDAQGLLC
ncbi:hypothetical protein RIF29_38060 [Crotalaria pallida]|uniref:Uncharacterized protein n=1 Tax=Crotalaria pallida TaxID=3830 RepID=A0AAN9E0Z7_CROPI